MLTRYFSLCFKQDIKRFLIQLICSVAPWNSIMHGMPLTCVLTCRWHVVGVTDEVLMHSPIWEGMGQGGGCSSTAGFPCPSRLSMPSYQGLQQMPSTVGAKLGCTDHHQRAETVQGSQLQLQMLQTTSSAARLAVLEDELLASDWTAEPQQSGCSLHITVAGRVRRPADISSLIWSLNADKG
jgi:hypothetical protein